MERKGDSQNATVLSHCPPPPYRGEEGASFRRLLSWARGRGPALGFDEILEEIEQ